MSKPTHPRSQTAASLPGAPIKSDSRVRAKYALAKYPLITDAAPAKPTSARKTLYRWHSWVGFHLATVMLVILFTGTFATISDEIDWLLRPEMRVSPDGQKVSFGQMLTAVQAAYPNATVSSLSTMEGDHFAYRADTVDEYGVRRFVHVNQWTGEVTGSTHPMTVQRFFRDLHRYLFMPGAIGLPVVAFFSFVLAISLYTGLKTSRNWKTLMTRVRLHRGARVAVGDAHKFAGLWGIWFFVVIIATSWWYLAEWGARAAGSEFTPEQPALSASRIAELGDFVPVRDLDGVVATVHTLIPDLDIRNIYLPTRRHAAILVNGSRGNPLLRERADQVFLDPVSLEPLKVQLSENIGWVAWINELADPLHFGFFGGLTSKLIWFLFGAAMTGLSVSGVWLTYRRLQRSYLSRAQLSTLPVFVLSACFAVSYFDRFIMPDAPLREQILETRSHGELQATLQVALDESAQPTGELLLLLRANNGARVSVEQVAPHLQRWGSRLSVRPAAESRDRNPDHCPAQCIPGAEHRGRRDHQRNGDSRIGAQSRVRVGAAQGSGQRVGQHPLRACSPRRIGAAPWTRRRQAYSTGRALSTLDH